MDLGLPTPSPRGVMYLLAIPPSKPSRIQCWHDKTKDEFLDQLVKSRNRRVLKPLKRLNYRNHLREPNAKSDSPDKKERERFSNKKHYVLKHYELQDAQIYQKAESKHGVSYPARYAACYSNAFTIISRIHQLLHHARPQKVFERVQEGWYSISREDCKWVHENCTVCKLNEVSKGNISISTKCIL